MIKYLYKWLLLIILSFTSFISLAEVSDKIVEKILDLSGLTIQVNRFPGIVKASLMQEMTTVEVAFSGGFQMLLKSID
jgi:hypothetical protein